MDSGEPDCWEHWAKDQPSDTWGENCFESYTDGTWNNQNCGKQNDYACERAPLGN